MTSICNICAEALLSSQQDVSALVCGHTFHRNCLDQWWVNHQTCPTCRQVCQIKIDKLYIESSEDDIENLNVKIQQLQTTLDNSEDEKKRIQNQLSLAEAFLNKRPTTREIKLLKDHLSELDNKIRSSEEENILLREGASETAILLGTATQFQKKSEQQLMTTLEEKKKIESNLDALRKDKARVEKNLRERHEKIASLEEDIKRCEKENDELKRQVNAKMQQLEAASQLQEKSEQKLATTLQENKRIDSNLKELRMDKAKVEKNLREGHEKIASLEADIERCKKENKELKKQVNEKMQELQSVYQLKEESEQKLSTATLSNRELIRDSRREKFLVDWKMGIRDREISNLKKELESNRQEFQELQEDMTENKRMLEISNKNLEASECKLEAMGIENTTLLRRNYEKRKVEEELQAEISGLEHRTSFLSKENHELQVKVADSLKRIALIQKESEAKLWNEISKNSELATWCNGLQVEVNEKRKIVQRLNGVNLNVWFHGGWMNETRLCTFQKEWERRINVFEHLSKLQSIHVVLHALALLIVGALVILTLYTCLEIDKTVQEKNELANQKKALEIDFREQINNLRNDLKTTQREKNALEEVLRKQITKLQDDLKNTQSDCTQKDKQFQLEKNALKVDSQKQITKLQDDLKNTQSMYTQKEKQHRLQMTALEQNSCMQIQKVQHYLENTQLIAGSLLGFLLVIMTSKSFFHCNNVELTESEQFDTQRVQSTSVVFINQQRPLLNFD